MSRLYNLLKRAQECYTASIPAADVVPVVRCRDCKHVEYDALIDEYWCCGRRVTPDFYCADGMVKEEGEKSGTRLDKKCVNECYISFDAAIRAVTAESLDSHMDSVMDGVANRYHRSAERALACIPAADVVPVQHGHWNDMGDFISCSLCHATRLKEFESDYGVAKRLDVRTNYCPNCGAKMYHEEE